MAVVFPTRFYVQPNGVVQLTQEVYDLLASVDPDKRWKGFDQLYVRSLRRQRRLMQFVVPIPFI